MSAGDPPRPGGEGVVPATLLRRVAHEVVGVAGVVRGAAQRLGEADPSEVESLLAMLRRSAARLERTASRLREYGSMASASIEPRPDDRVDVAALVRRAAGAAEALCGRRGIRVESAVGPSACRCDEVLLEGVVLEVVMNAIRHASSAVRVTSTLEGERVEVVVEDDGRGFQATKEQLLDEPLAKAGAAHGLGIALLIADRVVSAHGGTLEFGASTLPLARHGTPGGRVVVGLPVSRPEA